MAARGEKPMAVDTRPTMNQREEHAVLLFTGVPRSTRTTETLRLNGTGATAMAPAGSAGPTSQRIA